MGRTALFAKSYMVGLEQDKRMNKKQCSQPSKNNAAAGYQGPVKIKLLKVAGLLRKISERAQTWAATKPDAREKRYVRGRRVWYSVLFFETRSTIIINICSNFYLPY